MPGPDSSLQAHGLLPWSPWSLPGWSDSVAGAKWGAITGVIRLVVFGGIGLNLLPDAPHDALGEETVSAVVAGVICGGLIVVTAFALAGAGIGALVGVWRTRHPNELAGP